MKVNLSKRRKTNNLKMLFVDDGRSSPASKEAIAPCGEPMGTSDRSLNFHIEKNKNKFKQDNPVPDHQQKR